MTDTETKRVKPTDPVELLNEVTESLRAYIAEDPDVIGSAMVEVLEAAVAAYGAGFKDPLLGAVLHLADLAWDDDFGTEDDQ